MGSVVTKVFERREVAIRPGDMINIKLRTSDLKGWEDHWALCESVDSLGQVWCYHTVTDDDIQVPIRKAVVRYQRLETILFSKGHYRAAIPAKYRVKNHKKFVQKLFWRVGRQVPDFEQLADDLQAFRDQVVAYDVKTRNSEHYCTHWRYGIGWSTGVDTDREIIRSTVNQISIITRKRICKETSWWPTVPTQ